MSLNPEKLKCIIEAALLAAGQPLSIDRLMSLFLDEQQPTREEIRAALDMLKAECESRGVELKEVSSGFRYQARQAYAEWVSRLWEEKPPRYSRALLETLALIAYRQPITRGEIEDVRGVTVSTNIIKTLLERDWVKVVGHRDVPGKPAMYATTKQFLDYFDLKSLSEMPTLAEIRDIDNINAQLDLMEPGSDAAAQDDTEGVEEDVAAQATDESTVEANANDAVAQQQDDDGDEDGADSDMDITKSRMSADGLGETPVTEEDRNQVPVHAADPM